MSDPYIRLGDKFALNTAPQHITVDITEMVCAMVPVETLDARAALCELLSRGLLDNDLVGHEPSLTMGYDLGSDCYTAAILCYKWPR